MIGELQPLTKGDFVDMIDLESIHGPSSVPIEPQRWYVLRTHPLREARVMRAFHRRNISYYFPTLRRTITLRGRHRDVVAPFFPGLIFIPDFECQNVRLREVDGLSGWLMCGECFSYLKASHMGDLRAVVELGHVPISKRKHMFASGQLVRVVDGPFASFTGLIERLDSNGRLSVLLDVFKRVTPVHLEEGQIEPVDVSTDTKNGSAGVKRRHRRKRLS